MWRKGRRKGTEMQSHGNWREVTGGGLSWIGGKTKNKEGGGGR